jgi:hypothetical protein
MQLNLVNSKYRNILNFGLNLSPKEEKFIHIYLVISKTLIVCISKEKSVL